ncbi:enolase C-terminal domain-like protein [Flavihumibacter sp. UBA7668]|uniref:enolase C-terminal domain-like protein n=1 Tax=Flavihumibacter sp. UBA7668 TaxID=1946542 RepID=UPI0025B81FE9|nr:enolase C-terminal domain-like protein [Flavihumibacter sp. UBA7668]
MQLTTDKGAIGWGQSGFRNEQEASVLIGNSLHELIHPATGILPGTPKHADIALYDLCGIILNQPVYKLLGAGGTLETPVYSGMIYLDELEPANNPAGLDKVLENCRWDYDFGYRQLKVKIGRSFKWYPHDKGLQTDIDIVNRIHAAFGKDTGILVDANNGYTLDDSKAAFRMMLSSAVIQLPMVNSAFPTNPDLVWNCAKNRDNLHQYT